MSALIGTAFHQASSEERTARSSAATLSKGL